MAVVIGIVLVVLALALAGWVGVALLNLVGLAIGGLVIGALARLVLPGRQAIGWLGTILCGVAGSFLGGVFGDLIGVGGLLQFVLGIALAGGIILLVESSERTGGTGLSRT